MKKMCLAFITFTVLATFGVQAQEGRGTTTEKWRCSAVTGFLKETILVELTRETLDGGAVGVGEVSVAGLTYPALFQVAGFDRR